MSEELKPCSDCQYCVCNTEDRCLGCGAHYCYSHSPMATRNTPNIFQKEIERLKKREAEFIGRIRDLENLFRQGSSAEHFWESRCKREINRNADLKDALASLIDGLDSNHVDEGEGLSSEEWDKRVKEAQRILKGEK